MFDTGQKGRDSHFEMLNCKDIFNVHYILDNMLNSNWRSLWSELSGQVLRHRYSTYSTHIKILYIHVVMLMHLL